MTKEQFKATYRLVFQYMMHRHQIIVSLTVIGVVMGCVLFAFWFYHFVCLAMRNSTTNEQHKYGQLQSFMRWRKRKKAELALKEKERKAAAAAADSDESTEPVVVEPVNERKYMFADYDMDRWDEANVYDLGIWNNLKMVYFPYSRVRREIESAHKRDDDAVDTPNQTVKVTESAEEDTDRMMNQQKRRKNKERSNSTKNGQKAAERKGQKLRKRRKAKK